MKEVNENKKPNQAVSDHENQWGACSNYSKSKGYAPNNFISVEIWFVKLKIPTFSETICFRPSANNKTPKQQCLRQYRVSITTREISGQSYIQIENKQKYANILSQSALVQYSVRLYKTSAPWSGSHRHSKSYWCHGWGTARVQKLRCGICKAIASLKSEGRLHTPWSGDRTHVHWKRKRLA